MAPSGTILSLLVEYRGTPPGAKRISLPPSTCSELFSPAKLPSILVSCSSSYNSSSSQEEKANNRAMVNTMGAILFKDRIFLMLNAIFV
jgi:hypothetical protein